MRARLLASLLALPVALWACGRSEFLDPRTQSGHDAGGSAGRDAGRDGGTPQRDAGSPGPDAGPKPWDAGTCTQTIPWKLESRSIAKAALPAGSAAPRMGSGVMLEVGVQLLSGCEELARVDVGLSPGNATDFITLSAYAWVQQVDGCEPVAPIVPTGVVVPGRGAGNLRVVVSDGQSPSNPMLLEYGVESCAAAACLCQWGSPPGTVQEFGACQSDCECAYGLSCLGGIAPGGMIWECLSPCTKQTDCPQSGCRTDGAPPFVCDARDACPLPQDCPPGYSCVIRDSPSFCRDERVAPTSIPCQCDAQCPPGQRCIDGFRDHPTCEIPCADNQDCPFTWMVCGTKAICVPLSK